MISYIIQGGGFDSQIQINVKTFGYRTPELVALIAPAFNVGNDFSIWKIEGEPTATTPLGGIYQNFRVIEKVTKIPKIGIEERMKFTVACATWAEGIEHVLDNQVDNLKTTLDILLIAWSQSFGNAYGMSVFHTTAFGMHGFSKSVSDTSVSDTSVSDTSASDTSASDTSASDTSASDTSASDTSASGTSASGTSASDTSASDTSASGTSASGTSASGTSASGTSASGTSASGTSGPTVNDTMKTMEARIEMQTSMVAQGMQECAKTSALAKKIIWALGNAVTSLGKLDIREAERWSIKTILTVIELPVLTPEIAKVLDAFVEKHILKRKKWQNPVSSRSRSSQAEPTKPSWLHRPKAITATD